MEALGICLDGNVIKFAHLARNKDQIEIINLEKVFLKQAGNNEEAGSENSQGYDDVLGLGSSQSEYKMEDIQPDFDSNALYNTFAKYPQQNLKVGLNISESDVSFVTISNGFSKKNKKNIRKSIKEELTKSSKDINDSNFGYIPVYGGDKYLTFYHNDNLPLLKKILDIKSGTKNRMKISLVDINELSLIDFFKNTVSESVMTRLLIYVGNEHSRILFFRGKELTAISQLINGGFKSGSLLNTLYGKILYEQDSSGLDEINEIYITGEGNLTEYVKFFSTNFKESKVTVLPVKNQFVTPESDKTKDIDQYTIPVAIAQKILTGKNKKQRRINFLPDSVRKQQKSLRFAWHGILLFLMIFASAGYFFRENSRLTEEINNQKMEINRITTQKNEVMPVVLAVDSVAKEITWYGSRAELVNKLLPKKMLFSDLFMNMSKDIDKINSVWIKNLSATNNNFTLTGNSIYRTRIHEFAGTFDISKILTAGSEKIRNKTIFNFSLSGQIPDRK